MKVHDQVKQYSDEWWKLRRGVPTASEFHRILNPSACSPAWICKGASGATCGTRHRDLAVAEKCSAKLNKAGEGEARFQPVPAPTELAAGHLGYINQLIGDRFDAHYGPNRIDHPTPAMKRGTAMEPESRKWYQFDANCKVAEVGIVFSDNGRLAFSPDGWCPPGGVECKNPKPETHIEWLRRGGIPDEHRAQVLGPLACCKAIEWWDFVSYCPGLPALRVRATRSDPILPKLAEVLDQFLVEYDKALAQVAAMRGTPLPALYVPEPEAAA